MSAGRGESKAPPRLPRSGDVLRITRAASVQFRSAFDFRMIRVHDWPTYHGWIWLDGYELNAFGDAVERRSIFVQVKGLEFVQAQPPRVRYQAPQQRRNRGPR